MALPATIPILELNAVNPLLYPFGPAIPKNFFVLLIHIPIVGGFGMAAYYIMKYLKRFYGQRPIPKEWKVFWWAMILGTIHELIEISMLYQWIVGKIVFLVK